MAPRADPNAKYLADIPSVGAGGAPAVGGKKAAPIGVPAGFSVDAGSPQHQEDYGNYFRPGGHAQVSQGTSGMDTLEVPTIQAHTPLYNKGAEQAIRNLSVENLARLQGQMAQVGLISKGQKFRVGVPDETTIGAYTKLLTVANNYAISDTAALDFLKSNPQVAIKKDGTIGPAGSAVDTGPVTTTQTQKSTTNVTALDAEQIANQAYQDALGANATPKQRKALQAALQAYAGAHPTISKSTSTTDPQTGHTDTSTSTSGGVDAGGLQQIAQDAAKQAPDYAKVQAGTTYFNALQQALGATANVG